jgi:hypothetical protein
MYPNIAADRKRSRTSGTVAIRGRQPYADAVEPSADAPPDPPPFIGGHLRSDRGLRERPASESNCTDTPKSP